MRISSITAAMEEAAVVEQCRSSSSSTSSRMRRTRLRPRRLLQFVLVLWLALVCDAQSQQCAVGLNTPGRTWPAGDIVLEYGSSLRILCILNQTHIEQSFPGKSSHDLVFFKGKNQIDRNFITVLNETTIQLDISKPLPDNDMYYCKLKLGESSAKNYEAVCLNKVVVGFKPLEPSEFGCISKNWENMTCSWKVPHNYVDTNYAIKYWLAGRAGRNKLYPCPKPEGVQLERNSCYWDATTNPIYRQPYEMYYFVITGDNVLGHFNDTIKFHHYAHVVPARPVNLTVANKTLDSVLLQWDVPFPMQNFPPGLHHRVAYQNQWDNQDTWQIINITRDPHLPNRSYNLTGLKYANTIYDIRVVMRSAQASREDRWSNFTGVTFRTPPRIPGKSPLTDVGSFEIQENNLNRDIYLYWQTIPPYLENGNDFRYQVTYVEENGRRVFLQPNETTRTYAKFKALGHSSNYRFKIVSSNEVGILEKPARIFVPSRGSMPKEPIAFTKIAFEDGLYELSWKAPLSGDKEITNYTIFWCENERDRPYQCQGYLEWVHVSNATFVHNITVPDPRKVYQFAIAANTERASSGMVWASCTVIHNKVVGKMKTVWINHIDSTVIEVGWKLDCSDRIGIVEGFKIYYCPIVSPYNLNCKGPKLNTTIKADLNAIRGEVRGLKPYTTYMIAVAVLTKNGEGQHSDPLYNTTLESKPSDPPREVTVSNVTNTTMHVKWEKPLAMNGVLRYHLVKFDDQEKKVEEVQHVDLPKLRANHNYSITVVACTVECSEPSQPVYALTDIGVPDVPTLPMVRFMNSSRVRVFWNRPQWPAGLLDYYQIKNGNGEIINVTSTEALISIPNCNTVGQEKLYKFHVRAVNIDKNGEHLYGNWSDAGEGNCFSGGPSYSIWVIVWVIGSICGIMFVFCVAYSSKRVWLKCRAMQDVEVKLPPGLAPHMKLLQKGDQHTRQSSADSSGCSSGQESVTSSLTSDSQVSNDSGAEVDSVPKKMIIDATADSSMTTASTSVGWESSSLRQRNVAGASKPASLEATRWADPYVKVAKGSNELVTPAQGQPAADSMSLARSTPNLNEHVGFPAPQQTWSSAGYLSMSSTEEMSNNPSPVPKESLTNPGSYSVVGALSKSPMRSKADEEALTLAKTRAGNESELKTTTNPYVSLASFDHQQKPKDSATKTLDSLRVFDELGFDKSKQQQQQQSDKQPLTRPYVQTGFLDSKKSGFDPKRKPLPNTTTLQQQQPQQQQQQQQTSFFTQTSLAEELANKLAAAPTPSDSKGYVAVSSLPEIMARKPEVPPASTSSMMTTTHKPYVAVSQLPPLTPPTTTTATTKELGDAGKESETKSSVFQQLLQQQHPPLKTPPSAVETLTSLDESQEKVGLYPSLELEAKDELSRSNSPVSSFGLVWNPNPEVTTPTSTTISPTSQQQQQQQPQPQKTTTGYVTLPEQKLLPGTRFVKPTPTSIQQQQQQQSSDDQSYSKVAVVPRTMN